MSSAPLVTTDEAEAAPATLTTNATDAAAAAETAAETVSDIAPETATPRAEPEHHAQELTPANSANTTGNSAATNANSAARNDLVVAAPVHLPPAEPRPWYRSRRSFSAKGRGGRVQVAGLGITYTDHVTGAVLLANIDLGFRARSLSAILDPTGRRARALFLILAGLEEPQLGRIVAAPSRSLAARLAGRIGSVALIRADSPLDESLTIRQNILAPLSATGSVADWDNLVGALQMTGLAQRVEVAPLRALRVGALQGPHRPRDRVRRRGLPHRRPRSPCPRPPAPSSSRSCVPSRTRAARSSSQPRPRRSPPPRTVRSC